MSDKRTGKKKKKIRTTVDEAPTSAQRIPGQVPKQVTTPPKR